MSEDRWKRLLQHVARERERPSFDADERDYRLAVAAELRAVVGDARAGNRWRERLVALLHGTLGGRRFDLTQRIPARWVGDSVPAEALAPFDDAGMSPRARMETFTQAVAERLPKLSQPLERWFNNDPDQHAALALGSLFNFAAEPERLPIVHPERLNALEQSLGEDWTFRLPVPELYERHLAFVDAAGERMRAAGIALRDMLDLQGLVAIAAVDADFWLLDPARDPRARPRANDDATPYLSVCAIYRNEAHYLREWLEFHRLVGVERFFLYDNGSEDDHLEVLAPYLDEGIVTVRPWPVLDGQISAYNDCLRSHRFDSRWLAMIDLDEFLFSPATPHLAEALREFERWPAVAVPWAQFGTGGHRTRPDGLVLESYTRRIPVDPWQQNVKCVVDPVRVTRCLNAHRFESAYLATVDEHHHPVRGNSLGAPTYDKLRINHYIFKSEEEYVRKAARWHEIRDNRKTHVTPEMLAQIRAVEERDGFADEAVLPFLPALRDALAARAGGAPRGAPQPG